MTRSLSVVEASHINSYDPQIFKFDIRRAAGNKAKGKFNVQLNWSLEALNEVTFTYTCSILRLEIVEHMIHSIILCIKSH